MIVYYLILIIYLVFSKPSAYMLQNEAFKNNFDLLWCYMHYIIKRKRYKIVILTVAAYLQTPYVSFDFYFASIA